MGIYDRLRKAADSSLAEALDQAVVIRVQQVADYYYRDVSTQDAYNKMIHVVTPPFNLTWMEFSAPETYHVLDRIIAWPKDAYRGVGILLWDVHETSTIIADVFLDFPHIAMYNTPIPFIPVTVRFQTDNQGIPQINSDGSVFSTFVSTEAYMNDELQKLIAWCMAIICDVMTLALTFLNTRNVVLEEIQPQKKVDRKKKKILSPEHSFKIIRITPMRSRKRYASSTEQEDQRAWHKVRGHFKTYTEEHKLFGRWTGTYWWMDTERGTMDAGEIQHEYEVDLTDV